MGIKELLPRLKFVTQPGSMDDFRGQKLAVDTSSWLHKAAYSLGRNYVEGMERGSIDSSSIQKATKYIIKRCEALLFHFHIAQIHLVLDGERCPLKAATNRERETTRRENLTQARKLQREAELLQVRGINAKDKKLAAEKKYMACIKVSAELTRRVIPKVVAHFQQVAPNRVFVVQSPYEADPQLVKLCLDGFADAIVTEDSDVLLYCATARSKAPVIFKLAKDTYRCDILHMGWLLQPMTDLGQRPTEPGKRSTGIEALLETLVLREQREPGKGVRAFVQACCVTGSDYSTNELTGVGLVHSFKSICEAFHRHHDERFRHLLRMLKARSSIDVDSYAQILAQSECIFYYHPVLDLKTGQVVYLNDPQQVNEHAPSLSKFDDISFVGVVGTRPSVPTRTCVVPDGASVAPQRCTHNPYAPPPRPSGKENPFHAFKAQQKKDMSACFFSQQRDFVFLKAKAPPVGPIHLTTLGRTSATSTTESVDTRTHSVNITQSQEIDPCPSEEEVAGVAVRRSSYFSASHSPVLRRVSTENLDTPVDESEETHFRECSEPFSVSPLEPNVLGDFDYDGSISPLEKTQRDVVNSQVFPREATMAVQPLATNVSVRTLLMKQRPTRTIGPAKVHRNRFFHSKTLKQYNRGGLKRAAAPPHQTLLHHFKRKLPS